MTSDFDLTIEELSSAEDPPRRLPVNFVLVGEIQMDDVRVYIKQDTYRRIEEFAASDVTHELGSILLGYESTELDKQHVVISDFIEAKHTDATVSTLTFTHETWDYVHAEKERLFPDSRIVGWQHTHPNYGIFLSDYDLFIQKNYFDLPFHVAYVVDPIARTRGFFQWKNGSVQRLNGFYVFDEPGKRVDLGDDTVDSSAEPSAGRGPGRALLGVTLALLVLTVALGVWLVSTSRSVSRLTSSRDELAQVVQDQRGAIRDQQAAIAGQKAKLAGQQAELDSVKKQLAAAGPSPSAKPVRVHGVVTFRRYRVKRGDNLTSICKKNGIDYRDNIAIIVGVNGLQNANVIYAGSTILLPVSGQP